MLAGQWQNMKVVNVNPAAAQTVLQQWQALSQESQQPAGFNAPELVLPILKQLPGATLATVSQGSDLLLAVPLMSKLTHRSSWATPLTSSGLPHVSAGLAEAAMQAFIAAQGKPLLLTAVPADGPFASALQRQAAHFAVVETWQRAGLMIVGTFENWLQNNFDHKRRKEFKRLRARLAEQGQLAAHTLQSGQDEQSFVADLLALEAAGWKGKKGTAIADDEKMLSAFKQAARQLHTAGKLRFWSLKLDDKPLASLFAIVEDGEAWLGKIAYDEGYAKYSPGVQVILDATEALFAEPGLQRVDSSAIPNHPMIDRIWRDRLPMISVFVAPATIPKWRFTVVVALHKLQQAARALLRDTYYKFKGVKRS